MFRQDWQILILPCSENHPNISTALKMFTIGLQPKSVASHLPYYDVMPNYPHLERDRHSPAFMGGFMMDVAPIYPTLVKTDNDVVRDGAKVKVWYEITLRDNLATTYSNTEEFVQGQHIIPPALEQRVAGMQPGEAKTFRLTAEEGFGSYDETMTQTIQTADLPLNAHEGDSVHDDIGRTATIAKISPETTVLDFNHPLAGKPLIVTLQIMTIENPENHSGLARLSEVLRPTDLVER